MKFTRTSLLTAAALASAILISACGSASHSVSAQPVAPSASLVTQPLLKITKVSCGAYTASQKSALDTGAPAGFVAVITYTGPGTITAPQLDVSFIHGSTVDSSNVNGNAAQLSHGQSEDVVVDNLKLTSAGAIAGTSSDTCEVTSYGFNSPNGQWVTSNTASSNG